MSETKHIDFVMETIEQGGGPRNIYTLSYLLNSENLSSRVLSFFDVTKVPIKSVKRKVESISSRGALLSFPKGLTSHLNLLFSGYGRVDPPSNLAFKFAQQILEPASLEHQCVNSDVLVATAWKTVNPLIAFSRKFSKKLCYFVQADEATFSLKNRYSKLAESTYYKEIPSFTQSRVLVDKFMDKYDVKLHYIGLGIDHNVFAPTEKEWKKTIFTIARFEHFKGFDTFVKAINYLWKIRKDFNIVIAGQETALQIEPIEFPFEFVGWIVDDIQLAKYYSGSIFVNTGRDEALPMPPLEAMACGSFNVSTNLPGIREYAVSGSNCILTEVDDYKGIAEAISLLLDNSSMRESISKEAIRTANYYNWEDTLNRLKSFFKTELGI